MKVLFKSKIQKNAARDLVAGMTYQQIADKYGVHVNTVSNWMQSSEMRIEVNRLRSLILKYQNYDN